jgi:hypothetical protein
MTDPTDASVQFEACPAFRPADDPLLCGCGWLEDDHGPGGAVVVALSGRRPRVPVPERRAS